MAMKELQDLPKIPSELMENLMKLTLRYFEERSRVSCTYLSFFLSALECSFMQFSRVGVIVNFYCC